MQTTKTMELENRAWRGIRAYTGTFVHNGQKMLIEIQLGWDAYYVTLELYQMETLPSGREYEATYGKHDGKFATFKEVLDHIEKTYGVKCTYPTWTKDLTNDWTWEQNIAYGDATVAKARSHGSWDEHVKATQQRNDSVSHEPFALMAMGSNVKITEIEMLKHIKDNPNASTEKIAKMFPTKEGYLSRLAHNYGNGQSPQIVGSEFGWKITEHGQKVLDRYDAELKEKGYCDSNFY